MAIRITGMYSGLDTESIINELASAQSYKKNKLVKAQKKLSWKQDAWKALNTKIYSFYQKLDDLRLQSSYLKKKTTVSNSNAIKVEGGKVDGAHSVSVSQLSKRASMTSGKLNAGKNYNYTGNATIGQLLGDAAGSFTGGSIRISDKHGGYVDINVDKDMKINDFVKAIGDNTSLTASYDQDNQRIYISSWQSGEDGNFYLAGNDAGGMEALKALKLISSNDIANMTAPGGEYDVWSKYKNPDGSHTAAYDELIKAEVLERLKAMKAQNDALEKENKDYDEANQKNLDKLKEILANADGKYDDYISYMGGFNSSWTLNDAAAIKQAGKDLYDAIYGVEQQATEDDGTPKVDADGNPVMERTGGMAGQLKTYQETLDQKKADLEQARKDLADGTGSQAAVDAAEAAVTAASKDVSDQQNKINKAAEVYSFYKAFEYNDDKRQANQDTIDKNNKQFVYSKDADGNETYQEKDASGNAVAIGSGVVTADVTAQFDKKVQTAQDIMSSVRNPDGTLNENSAWLKDAQGTKVDGQNSKVVVDGVTYESYNDTVTVNGLTITALETTDKDVTVSTADDTEGVYNMIKDFIKAYSELMNEMDSLYNADAAKGYEPLLTEEKDALSDSEIEEWENKIKESLLRRDSTLSDISSSMRMSMMMTMDLDGETISLADFGIATLGYFKAADNERNAYHIDGDADDDKTKANSDKLLRAISNNPEAVMNFFTKLTDGLHDTLADKRSAKGDISRALTVYNDKKMKKEYDEYTKKIKEQETKLNSYIDRWYAKFSAMETALARLESKNNSLSSLFGG
ncbi:MAG: flagellar filament capping protein FliD [Lachnospiraceae bacterium]|nr:flagellar filament capping protein FliD [Lachnospiraceae bacterium]